MKGYRWNKHHPYIIPGPFFIAHVYAVVIVEIIKKINTYQGSFFIYPAYGFEVLLVVLKC